MFLRLACLYILLVGSFGLENGAFEAYMEDFGKAYATEEVEHRRSIFLDNMAAIEKHNEPERSSGYEMGVNQFTDMLPEEIPTGYVKTYRLSNVAVGRRVLNEEDLESIIRTEPVSDLPQTVDWRNHGITTPVKNQHMCGSCWAFATTAVIESHVALATGTLFSLSEQELVSCAPNPLHCGGMGGCSGSTSEIAFEYARTHGMVDEFTFGYDSNHGAKVPCTLTERRMRGGDKQYVKDAVAAIEGWVTLPRNNYTAVMNTVAKLGPLAVTVACSPWVSYQRGIYAGDLETPKETNVRTNAGINVGSLLSVSSQFSYRINSHSSTTWWFWKATVRMKRRAKTTGWSAIAGDQLGVSEGCVL